MNKKRSGFTLLEIIIVVIVIGVLAAIALPRFNFSTDNARISEALEILNILKKEVGVYRYTRGHSILTSNGLTVCGNSAIESLGITFEFPDNSYFQYCISSSDGPTFNGSVQVQGNINNIRLVARNPDGMSSSNAASLSASVNEESQGLYKVRGSTKAIILHTP